MSQSGFDTTRIPDEMWMNSDEVVSQSLDALESGRVVVVPGEQNLQLAKAGLQQQLAALEQ